MNTQYQNANAIMAAMNSQRAFSWIKTHEVQKGVYLTYSQEFFQTYLLK